MVNGKDSTLFHYDIPSSRWTQKQVCPVLKSSLLMHSRTGSYNYSLASMAIVTEDSKAIITKVRM